MNLLDLIFPKFCHWCWQVWQYLCQDCKKTVKLHPDICPICKENSKYFRVCPSCRYPWDILDWILIWFSYNWVIKNLIKHYKYKWSRDLSRYFVSKLKLLFESNKILSENKDKILITYVPQHWINRYFIRWYNQSYLLARDFAKEMNLPLVDMFKKVKFTKKQAKLKRSSRFINLNWAFEINDHNINLEDKIILIFDDVVTTWTTIKKLSILLEWTKSKVWWFVLARNN